MDDEALQRRQSLKVIISELVMVIAVVATVCALAFVVSGYWVNSDFEIERNGMVQISSTPSGADLEIDGESSWLKRTNTSKILSSGEHHIVLTKEGYDSWSRTINISEGLLYRINYPRLFLQERKTENAYDVSTYTYATTSPDHTKLLLIGDTTEWSLVDLRHEKLQGKKIAIPSTVINTAKVGGASVGLFTGTIVSSDWDNNGRVLMRIMNGDKYEWIVVDTDNINNSLNLTASFGLDFSKVGFVARDEMLAISDKALFRINLPEKTISSALISDIYDYDYYNNEVIYSTLDSDGHYSVGFMSIDGVRNDVLSYSSAPILIDAFKFYDEMYIAVADEANLSIYKKNDYSEPFLTANLEFTPMAIRSGREGEFVVAYSGNTIAAADMEAGVVTHWQVAGEGFGWLDNYMPFSVSEGELIVYDFDGLNKRSLAKNVSSRFPALITDNKWLYYVSDGVLMRESLISS